MGGFQKTIKRQFVLVGVSLLVMLCFLTHASGWYQWQFLEQLENLAYDARIFFINKPVKGAPKIVIVDIDEKSISMEGRWPWGRDRMARLVDQLFDTYGISIVGFDLVFEGEDESSGLKVLERLGRDEFLDIEAYQQRLPALRQSLDYDGKFVRSISARPVFLGYFFSNPVDSDEIVRSGRLPAPVFSKKDFAGIDFSPPPARGYSANQSRIFAAAAGGGHFSPTVDEDGIIRRVPLLFEYDGNYYESLSLAMVRHILKTQTITPIYGETFSFARSSYTSPEMFQVGDRYIPIDEKSQVLVPYRGRQGSFLYVSAADVIRGNIDIETLRDAIVLVGASAAAVFDLRSMPLQKDNTYPGVEVHANLIAGMLTQTIKQRPRYVIGLEFLFLSLSGLMLVFLLPVFSPLWAMLATVMLLSTFIGGNFLIWQLGDLVVPIAPGVLMILILFLLQMSYGFFVERRGKRKISNLFGQYIPPQLVDEINATPGAYTQQAQSRELTVLFTDIRGFTTISEGLSPGDLSDLMNEYLTPMTRIIHDNRGTIDKYIGDAIMAFWGAPLDDPDHARHALMTAMAMLERLKPMREEFKRRGWPEIRIGAGINTGLMRVGNMGSEFRRAYTVMGDAVNLGSRLEGLTKRYGVELIVAASTMKAVADFTFRELDVVRVQGKDRPIPIYEPLAPTSAISKPALKELSLYAEALKYYRKQAWDMAEMQFLNLSKMSPERRLYQVYIERIGRFRNSPPGASWDGVFTYTTK